MSFTAVSPLTFSSIFFYNLSSPASVLHLTESLTAWAPVFFYPLPPSSSTLSGCPPSLLFCYLDHHYAPSNSLTSTDLLPDPSLLLRVWWGECKERKGLHPSVKDANCLGHSHTESPPLWVRQATNQQRTQIKEVKRSNACLHIHSFSQTPTKTLGEVTSAGLQPHNDFYCIASTGSQEMRLWSKTLTTSGQLNSY